MQPGTPSHCSTRATTSWRGGASLQCYDGDPAAPAQRVGADRDSGDRSPSAGHLGDHRYEGYDHLLLSAPLEVLLSMFGLFPAHDPADPLWRDRMANVATFATLNPVGALRTTALCLDVLYRLQIFQSYTTTQLVD